MKLLILDIETRPNLSYVWKTWEADAIDTVEEWSILSFAAKWLGEKSHVQCVALSDVKGSEETLLKILRVWLNGADIVIGHNLDAFDIPRINARFLYYGINPPSPYRTVDTYKIAKSKFYFNSNRLEALAKHLGIGAKVNTGGFELWKGCMRDDPKAWALMKKYNKHDVVLTEKVYLRMLPYMSNHPSVSVNNPEACPRCGAVDSMTKNGWRYNPTTKYQRYTCKACGASARGRNAEKGAKPLYVGI